MEAKKKEEAVTAAQVGEVCRMFLQAPASARQFVLGYMTALEHEAPAPAQPPEQAG